MQVCRQMYPQVQSQRNTQGAATVAQEVGLHPELAEQNYIVLFKWYWFYRHEIFKRDMKACTKFYRKPLNPGILSVSGSLQGGPERQLTRSWEGDT